MRTVAICLIDSDGKLVFECSVACEAEESIHCLRDLPTAAMQMGFEADSMSQNLFLGLLAAEFSVVCMEARQVNAALSAMRNKTGKTDPRGIAQVLRSGRHSTVYIKK